MTFCKYWKNFRPLLAFVFFTFCLLSCKDDDDVPSEPKQLTFIAPPESLDATGDYWAMISDAKGNLLDTVRLYATGTYTLKTPGSFNEQSVTLTLLEYHKPDSPGGKAQKFITTYVGIPFGTYGYIDYSGAGVNALVKGSATMFVKDLTNDDANYLYRWLIGPNINGNWTAGSSGDNPGISVQMNLTNETSSFVFTQLLDNDLYYIHGDISVGQYLNKTITDLKPAETKNVRVPVSDNVYVFMKGWIDSNSSKEYGECYPKLDETGTIAEIPYPGNAFTSYYTAIYAHTGDVYNDYYKSSGAIPEAMKTISGDVSYTVDGSNIQANQPIVSDMIRYTLYDVRDSYTSWFVYTDGGKQNVTIPLFPELLIDMYDLESFDDLYKIVGFESSEVYDFADFNGYNEFMAGTQIPTPLPLGEYWVKSKQVNRNTGGRMSLKDHVKQCRRLLGMNSRKNGR